MKTPYLAVISITVICVSISLLVYDAVSLKMHASSEHPKQHSHESDHGDSHSIAHNSNTNAQDTQPTALSDQLIFPIPDSPEINHELAKIGWVLFKDPNLSSNRSVSCESCHSLQTNGAEVIPVSIGVNGAGMRNSLTVFNAVFNYRFFWDGRVNNLGDQIDGPVHNVDEMDSNWQHITDYVSQSDTYISLFKEQSIAIDEASIKAALIEFMQGLTTPNAPFDRYLQGDSKALSETAERGWKTFQDEGCIRCHQGTNIGGGMVMRFGYFGLSKTGSERSEDQGRFMFTAQPQDKHLFRVASLRNVAITAPYFHDGQTATLEEAIKIMGESQLGKTFEKQTINDIKVFLETLTGHRPQMLVEFENE
ncbi:cytochrome c peroxidase [Vibrio sp. 10N.261.46.E12]|uniref:cytochrome-c peroxidase n=1 Tax=unclassified Vibrio TaxID=2614977 RepID=UPI0009778944|nr:MULTISPECIES: cytochrome c peroxidase [unclassified Vibrio]OMO35240.1 cytochrome B6 [Vibrio sp. 10N.261.45.E1]PMJ19631.1 cytochrome B6 [Vibrio sp. 10N.286.45.B6]PML98259.1 cytochrome B6 [Vibrio sp. 10N.261.49.E11]PMM66617.1 cytochrome B6 [Vibrio sp. 10N.261.46.F12]PMM86351.1 cytochrome B6 [Vibrio sp. 10N.261.46.E8]